MNRKDIRQIWDKMTVLRLISKFQSGLFLFPPEMAHSLTLSVLKRLSLQRRPEDDQRLRVSALGLTFSNPLGMAAGFDKNAKVAGKLLQLGFGFVEVGGVTPLPQCGNPFPRVFRLLKEKALINRLGFNNEGLGAMQQRLVLLRETPGIFGVNLGANKNSQDKITDYFKLIKGLDGLADYVTLNVSSPNTAGLRDLQNKDNLDALLQQACEARGQVKARQHARLRLLIKMAPDVELHDLDNIAELAMSYKIDGIIISNTTISRPGISESKFAAEAGGLSGPPLFSLSTRRLAQMRQRVGQNMTLIGVGGIDSGEAAWAKICAGADLLQLYTGLVYQGISLVEEIKSTLLAKLTAEGMTSVSQAVGRKTAFYAREST